MLTSIVSSKACRYIVVLTDRRIVEALQLVPRAGQRGVTPWPWKEQPPWLLHAARALLFFALCSARLSGHRHRRPAPDLEHSSLFPLPPSYQRPHTRRAAAKYKVPATSLAGRPDSLPVANALLSSEARETLICLFISCNFYIILRYQPLYYYEQYTVDELEWQLRKKVRSW